MLWTSLAIDLLAAVKRQLSSDTFGELFAINILGKDKIPFVESVVKVAVALVYA